jgi:hypothetical protein
MTNQDTERLYPNNFADNIDYRLKLHMATVNNPQAMSLIKRECSENILYWINSFVMTYNPRNTPSVIPFVTYPFQDKFILDLVDHIEKQKDILIDKSRDMGISWCVLAVFTWFWLFRGEGKDFLCGSRKEDYVDKIGDMKTLMQKIRFILKEQPKYLQPKGYKEKEHASFMRIRNPVTGSTIVGEATNDNFSRGGRQLAILFDEFAFWEVDASAWRSSADTSNCRIAVSTPCGLGNHFAKLRHSESIDVRSFHWKLHPDKDDEWYANEVIRRNNDTVEIAQELDICYEGSEEGVLFAWDELNKAKEFDAAISLDRIVLSLDPATTGDDEAVIYIANNGAIMLKRIIKDSTGDPIKAAQSLATDVVVLAKKHNVQVIIGDAIGSDVLALIATLMGDTSIKIITFKSSEKAENSVKFFNKRAELYMDAATAMKSGNLQVDDDYTLMKQLSATHYKSKNGRIIIDPKEDIKKRLNGDSPDRADAWALIAEGMKYTHSRKEVEAQNTFRKRENYDIVTMGAEYGEWPGDLGNDLI